MLGPCLPALNTKPCSACCTPMPRRLRCGVCWTPMAMPAPRWPPARGTGPATASMPPPAVPSAAPSLLPWRAACAGWRTQTTICWAGGTPAIHCCCAARRHPRQCCSWPATRPCCGSPPWPSSAAAPPPPGAAPMPRSLHGHWRRPACASAAGWLPGSMPPRTPPRWKPAAPPWRCWVPGRMWLIRRGIACCWSALRQRGRWCPSTRQAPPRCARISPAATASSPA